jgi:hypothetical protein
MADDNQFVAIWEDALSAYYEKTGHDLLKDKALKKLQTIDELLAHIEAQNSKFKDFRGKKKKLWDGLTSTMRPVEVLGDIARTALDGSPFGSAGLVFAAVNHLIVSAKGVSEAYGSIIELLDQLADFSDRMDEYSQDTMDAKLKKRVIQILATLLEVFAQAETIMAMGRLSEFGRTVFLGKSKGVEDAVSKLEGLVISEGRFVTAKTYSTTVSISKEVGRMTALQLGKDENPT